MTRTLLVVFASSFLLACGSRAEYSVSSATATRAADATVLVTAVVGAQLLGTRSGEDQVTELCLEATWSNASDFDGGASSSDGGTDAGTASVVLLPTSAVGETLSVATACKPGNGATFELRSPEAIPQDRKVIVTLRPSQSEASRSKRTSSAAPVLFRDSQFISP